MSNKNCDHAKDQLLEELQDGMSESGFQLFREKYVDCKEELDAFYKTITQLDEMEKVEPSPEMDSKFYAMLTEEISKEKTTSPLRVSHRRSLFKNIAVAASLFMVGALTSFYFFGNTSVDSQSTIASEEVTSEDLILASSSSMKRLETISDMKNAPELNDKIIDALNKSLVNDPNVNVRLSAIEAMVHYADNPKVRENLIKAIPYQDSPIIQMTLAEVMIALEEGSSKDEWLELFKSDNMDADVKEQLEETLAPVLKL